MARESNLALRALDRWDQAHWPAEAPGCAAACRSRRADAEVHDRIQRLLRGEPLDLHQQPG